jgi:hypothetical protein
MRHFATSAIAALILAAVSGERITVPAFDDAYSRLVGKLESGETDIDYKAFRESFIESKQFQVAASKRAELDRLKATLPALMEKASFSEVARTTKSILSIDYTNMRAHKILQQTYKALKDEANQKKYHDIEFGLLNSIVKNGNGRSCATAWPVVQIEEEYFILEMLGAKLTRQTLDDNGGLCDKMEVSTEEGKATYYFGVEKVFEGRKRLEAPGVRVSRSDDQAVALDPPGHGLGHAGDGLPGRDHVEGAARARPDELVVAERVEGADDLHGELALEVCGRVDLGHGPIVVAAERPVGSRDRREPLCDGGRPDHEHAVEALLLQPEHENLAVPEIGVGYDLVGRDDHRALDDLLRRLGLGQLPQALVLRHADDGHLPQRCGHRRRILPHVVHLGRRRRAADGRRQPRHHRQHQRHATIRSPFHDRPPLNAT